LGGLTPSASGARGAPLSVTTADSSGTLPTGAEVVVTNVGTNPMYCNVNAIAATTSDQLITANGGWFGFAIPSGVTALHCIATGGSTTANTLGGAGLPTGTGGGGGGGGSSGAVYGPTTAGSAAANPPVLMGGTVDGTSTGNVDNWKISGGIGYVNAVNSGTFLVQLNATPSLANGNGVVPTQGGAVLSATNGIYSNLLQGNAVLSATNGLYTNLLQGNAAISSGNPIFAELVTGSGTNQNVNLNQLGGQALQAATVWGTAPTTAQYVLNANVNCIAGCGGSGGTSLGDNASYSGGTTSFTPVGGVVGASALTSGHAGAVAMDTGRNMFINFAEMGGTAINSGCVSNYGTAPSAVACPSVNAYVTDTLTALVNNADSIAPISSVTSTAGASPVNSYNYGFDGTNWDRLRVDPTTFYLNTTPKVSTTGGWTPLTKTSLSTTVFAIKSSGGQLSKAMCDGTNTAIAYLELFNVASGSVTLGTTAYTDFVPLQPGLNSGFVESGPGEQFGTAMSAAVVTTLGGSTATGTPPNCSFAYN